MENATRLLDPKELAPLLEAGGRILESELKALPQALASWHPAPGEWCAKEVLGHLIEAERRGFAGRIRVILGGDRPALAAWDQVVVARERRDCGRELDGLLEEFAGMRRDSVDLVGGLSDDDLERGGDHPKVGHLRVRDLLHEWVHHDRNHLKQILANVQAFVWPALGNAQGFAGE
jgi:hypothetical protein